MHHEFALKLSNIESFVLYSTRGALGEEDEMRNGIFSVQWKQSAGSARGKIL